jgi:uncharacterized protein (TIGR00251 family)
VSGKPGAKRGPAGASEPPSVTFDVLVQPRASRAKLGPRHDGRIKVAVTAPPVDGEANAAVIELVAASLGVPRGAVEVIAGASSRRKTLRVTGASAAQLAELVP